MKQLSTVGIKTVLGQKVQGSGSPIFFHLPWTNH